MQLGTSAVHPRVVLLALVSFVLGTDSVVIVGMLSDMAVALHVTEAAAGQLVSLFALTYGIGAPVFAAVSGRRPPNRVLIAAMVVFCAANVGCAFAESYPLLLTFRILAGCSAAVCSPLAFTLAAKTVQDEKRGRALSFVALGGTAAVIIGGPLGTWVGEHWGWRLSFGVVAAAAGIAALALLFSGMSRIPAAGQLPLRARLSPLYNPRVLSAFVPVFLAGLGFHSIYTYLAPMLQANLRIDDISGMLISCGVGSGAGSWLGGIAADRYGVNRSFVSVLLALIVIEIALPYATRSFAGAILSLFVWSGAVPCLFLLQQHRLLTLNPENANVLMGLNNAFIYVAMAGGAALGGASQFVVPLTKIGWTGAICSLAALTAFLLGIRRSVANHRVHSGHGGT
jgi:predicted MFS family arabinose efflux permease